MKQLFISDLHLSEQRPAVSRAFFHFLDKHASSADALYILGDLFEAWIGDDDPSELARSLIQALSQLTRSGTAVYVLHGNRDFLIGRRFARQTGCTLLPDYPLIQSQQHLILACHGDTLCITDTSYQKFRRKVRNPFYRWFLSHLPLKKRQKIAKEWRAKSIEANSNKPENIMDVSSDEVDRVLAKYKATILIHGHTHRPGVHSHTTGERIVLGDWGDSGWYIQVEDDDIRLIDFAIKNGAETSPKTTPQAESTEASLEVEPEVEPKNTTDKVKAIEPRPNKASKANTNKSGKQLSLDL